MCFWYRFYFNEIFPVVILVHTSYFSILYRWGNVISFFQIFLKKKIINIQDKMSKKEALEILHYEGASREQIISSHQKLVVKKSSRLRRIGLGYKKIKSSQRYSFGLRFFIFK